MAAAPLSEGGWCSRCGSGACGEIAGSGEISVGGRRSVTEIEDGWTADWSATYSVERVEGFIQRSYHVSFLHNRQLDRR